MSDVPGRKVVVQEIHERCIEERRNRQLNILKKWDMGKLTGRQCIESIIELEKMLYIGNQIEQIRRRKQ